MGTTSHPQRGRHRFPVSLSKSPTIATELTDKLDCWPVEICLKIGAERTR